MMPIMTARRISSLRTEGKEEGLCRGEVVADVPVVVGVLRTAKFRRDLHTCESCWLFSVGHIKSS